ncbi:sporulation integral membrane protein YlbJ [Clostridium thermosuccinogenes]|uniref:Sporulation integral membrane protein YlbJ n=1 Tax=Clostridium thermosuccinogenes TaxID=84032 RepID=A0A2K2FIW5_9CLOT|nr:sporulation integral membrane protein YlbJ [Pseudoclostridium thermosuccinogenes]AUS96146.1 sporulation integral membrane protein YlbJ [Pseudoclostridium thermosuccinogenes]PNT98726.1 sporulation integral membrane protein YlbJ [Pseudoclostridium thermosuccinogenes]PNU00725.1 sporulation integral membrane protein YlbJ [Pseudoclostridium thermosuccinogenes]
MSWYFYIIIALIIISLAFSCRSFKVIYLKNLVLPSLCVLFIICLVIFSKTAVASAYKGIKLWIEIVFPSLFPFFVASELLNKTGLVKAVGILLEPVMRPLFNVPGCGSFAFAMGITSGYPVGAKITSEMRKEGLLTKVEAERLLTFTNNSGPLFIIGAVSVGMFKMPRLGLFLLGCHVLASTTVGIIFRFYGRKKESSGYNFKGNLLKRLKNELAPSHAALNPGKLFGDAVRNSVNLLLAIGGFIIFFSVIINLLLETGFIKSLSDAVSAILRPLGINQEISASIISGFFEITTGVNMAANAEYSPLIHRLTAASFIMGWAGLSVHSQVISMVGGTDISIKPYLLGKFLQGVFAGVYSNILLNIVWPDLLETHPAFIAEHPDALVRLQGNFFNSVRYLVLSVFLMAVLFLISFIAARKKEKRRNRKTGYSGL